MEERISGLVWLFLIFYHWTVITFKAHTKILILGCHPFFQETLAAIKIHSVLHLTISSWDIHTLLCFALVWDFTCSPDSQRPLHLGGWGIRVVSDHCSIVLTYIHVGSVDTVYYIWHNCSAQQSRIDLVLNSEGSASGRHNPAGSAAKHTVTHVISGSMTLGKGPLPGTPSF